MPGVLPEDVTIECSNELTNIKADEKRSENEKRIKTRINLKSYEFF